MSFLCSAYRMLQNRFLPFCISFATQYEINRWFCMGQEELGQPFIGREVAYREVYLTFPHWSLLLMVQLVFWPRPKDFQGNNQPELLYFYFFFLKLFLSFIFFFLQEYVTFLRAIYYSYSVSCETTWMSFINSMRI